MILSIDGSSERRWCRADVVATRSSRLICSFWHCRSRHSRTTRNVVRLHELCPCMVSVVPSRSFLLCRLWWTSLHLYLYNMWNAPRLCSGPTPFHDVHGWTWERHLGTWTPMPHLCWWQAGLRSLLARLNWMPFWQDFELCGRHQWLDVQQSSPTERQQNWGDVVLLRSTCTWTLFQIGHQLRPDPASTICPQPWDLARRRLFHDHSDQQNN